ncbi:MAG: single-stranded DNA-binding protein [Tepidisphaerales bacterium]
MASFNRVLLLGNLTRDPTLRYLPSQMAVADFGMACNRKFRTAAGEDREEVVFVDCTAWGKQAEVINQYCQKGKQLFIEGRLKLDQWEDKNGGGKRSKLTVVVENFQLLGSRDGGQGGGAPAQGQGPEYNESDAPPAARPSPRAPQAAPVRRPAPPAGGAAPQAAPPQQPEPPISEEQHFGESDIPF